MPYCDPGKIRFNEKIFMNEDKIELIVPEEYHLERIDRFLANSLELDFSRSYIQRLIKKHNILVNGV